MAFILGDVHIGFCLVSKMILIRFWKLSIDKNFFFVIMFTNWQTAQTRENG